MIDVKGLATPAQWFSFIEDFRPGLDRFQLYELFKLATKSIDFEIYKTDPLLLRIWIEYVHLERKMGIDYNVILSHFNYMKDHGFVDQPPLYLAWADLEISKGNKEKARKILLDALEIADSPKIRSLLAKLESESTENPRDQKLIHEEKENAVEKVPEEVKDARVPLKEKPLANYKNADEKMEFANSSKIQLRKKLGRIGLGPPARFKRSDSSSAQNGGENDHTAQSNISELSRPLSPALTDSPNQTKADRSANFANVSEVTRQEVPMDITLIKNAPEISLVEASSSHMPSLKNQRDKLFTINKHSYHKIDVIGKGGSSKVYKILDDEGRVFALKRVKLKDQDPTIIDGYLNEISLLKKLQNNDRIIRLVDAEQNQKNGELLMVLEYGEIDLDHLLQKNQGKCSLNFIRNYWEQMLQAVDAIHQEDVIHSDLKPANFLLVGGFLKLIDFGIAKSIPNDTTNIQRDYQTGTVNYMAPEAISYVEQDGEKQNYLKLGRASDVWSLGCILYRFVYGSPPFGNMPLMRKLHAITNPNHVISFPTVPDPQLKHILQGCLQRNAKKRLTVHQLLNHPFLHPEQFTSSSSLCEILSMAMKLGLEPNNISEIASKLADQLGQ